MSAELKLAMAHAIARKILDSQQSSLILKGHARNFLSAEWTAEDDGDRWEYDSIFWRYVQAHKEEWEGKL